MAEVDFDDVRRRKQEIMDAVRQGRPDAAIAAIEEASREQPATFLSHESDHGDLAAALLHEIAPCELRGEDGKRVMRALIDAAPDTTMAPRNRWFAGDLPLHEAARNCQMDTDVFKMLLDAAPQAAMVAGFNGALPLHRAAGSQTGPQGIAVVDLLLRVAPQAALTGDENGRLPLHVAVDDLSDDADVALVEHLIDCAPEALMHADNNGRLPLHVAFYRWRFHKALAELLLTRAPKAADVLDNGGNHLVHLALARSDPTERIQCLIDMVPSAVSGVDTSGATALHRVRDKALARLLLQTSPATARVADDVGRLPIHVVRDEDVFKMLLEAAPDTAAVADNEGKTPLHYAATGSSKNVQLLLQVAKETASVVDNEGKSPLHFAVEMSSENAALLLEAAPATASVADKEGRLPVHSFRGGSRETLSRLIRAAPDCLLRRDKHGRVPLHYAVQQGSQDARDLMLRLGPDAASIADNDGRYPLHWIFCEQRWSPCGEADIVNLVEASPQAAVAADSVMGRTPLCYAVLMRNAHTTNLKKALIQKAPSAASIRDAKGDLPLHIVSNGKETSASVDVLKCLVEAAPETATAVDENGRTALDIAVDTGAGDDLVSYLVSITPDSASKLARLHSQRMEKDPTSEILPKPFGPADYGDGFAPQTVLELQLMRLSAAIRRKLDWRHKIHKRHVVKKWREESRDSLGDRADEKFDYVIKELREVYSGLLEDDGTDMATVDGVYQSTCLIGDELKQQLLQHVNVLEASQHDIDWHPGSNEQVRDLVHPSLYPLVFGVSRGVSSPQPDKMDTTDDAGAEVSSAQDSSNPAPLSDWRKHVGGGKVLTSQVPADSESSTTRSRMSQWLPAEVDVANDGKVSFLSYINNLHPERHAALYAVLEQVLSRLLPLFSRCLGFLQHPCPNRIKGYARYEPFDPSELTSSQDEDEAEERYRAEREPLPLTIPENPIRPVNYRYPLNGRRLQVIVKLANIELTPEKPKYDGGVWHVEGMENEQIVATGIYYYESTNITESKLKFRRQVCEPDYEQGDDDGVWKVFGLQNDEPLNQNIGHVVAKEDVCIAFPNMYQHRVAPFELQDQTKPGRRRILVFFLIDPMVRIWSTADVPPQQREWYADVLAETPPFASLPRELVDGVVKHLDWPMSREEAEKHRLRLMEERKYVVRQNNEERFERPFSLCEH